MESVTFLAMTAAEIGNIRPLPPKLAWMACHFSPYGTGLTNLPRELPSGSLLILNDRIPICGHDPQRIRMQLREAVTELHCAGLLLDFQRPDCLETARLVRQLCECLSCPTAVSAAYSQDVKAAVFLPPPPHHVPLAEYTAPWEGREIWLEAAMDGETITLTEDGASIAPCQFPQTPEDGHPEDALHCHYRTSLTETAAEFTLWRTAEDMKHLLAEAKQLGIQTAVGLYQEFKSTLPL